jgi:translation initiation factor IF-2
MENDLGEKIKDATFSTPVTIIGWSELVPAGAEFKTFNTKSEALEYAETFRTQKIKNIPEMVNPDEAVLPIIIKADTLGSLEAIGFEIKKIGTELIKPKIISEGVGAIGEGDIKSANVGKKAYVFGFNTKVDSPAKILAERDGITVEVFSIIYKLTERIQALLEEQRPRIRTEEITGSARILRTFSRQKDKQIIGGKVDEGVLMVNETVKIIRRETEIGTGRIRELQQQKKEVDEIKAGTEFGSLVESKFELAVGDVLQAIRVVEK